MNDIINELRQPVATSFDPDCVEQVVTEMYKRGLKAADIIEQQQKRIAELEAREAVLREAFHAYIDEHEECTDADGWMAMICPMDAHHVADEALSQPADDSALKAVVQRAGEVMRERCATSFNQPHVEWFGDSIQLTIRALPGVMLEDLKETEMIGTASLEQWERDSQYVTQLRAENAKLKRQHDELLAALEKMNEVYDAMGAPRGPSRIIAEAAIARVKGIK